MTLSHFLPISDAASKFGLAETNLRALVDMGTIRAGLLPTGEMIVSAEDTQAQKPTPKEELPEYKKHAHLKGQEIWLSEAARQYNLPLVTLSQWVKRGIIRSIGADGNKVLLDEADIAYCVEIYHKRGGQGKRLFNNDGTPYKPKTGPLENTH